MIPEFEANGVRNNETAVDNGTTNSVELGSVEILPQKNTGCQSSPDNMTIGKSQNRDTYLKALLAAASEQLGLTKLTSISNGAGGKREKTQDAKNSEVVDSGRLVIDLTDVEENGQCQNGAGYLDYSNSSGSRSCKAKQSSGTDGKVSSGDVGKASVTSLDSTDSSTSSTSKFLTEISLTTRLSTNSQLLSCDSGRYFPPYGADTVEENKPFKISRSTQVFEWELEPKRHKWKRRYLTLDGARHPVGNKKLNASVSSHSTFSSFSEFRHSYFAKLSGQHCPDRASSSSTPAVSIPQRIGQHDSKTSANSGKRKSKRKKKPANSVNSLGPGVATGGKVGQAREWSSRSVVLAECARHLPFNGIRKSRNWFSFLSHPFRSLGKRSNGNALVEELEQPEGKRRRKAMIHAHPTAQFEWLRRNPVAIRLGRSRIHGVGVFADEDISAGQFIVEYKGELIRNILVERKEKLYRSKGLGSYMFAIDLDFTIDGTMKGGMARFVNHSCEPNCSAKVVKCDDTEKHIVLLAAKNICKGEELSYDYKMPKDRDKIPCLCGSSSCRKYLN